MLFSPNHCGTYKASEQTAMSAPDTRSPLISPAELAQRVDDPDWIIVDCRFNLMDPSAGQAAWQSGHVPGAYYADLDRDLAAPVAAGGAGGRHPLPEREGALRLLRSWGMHAGSTVVAYDDVSNAIAARLWWLLRWFGHQDVAVLDGGLQAWEAGGHPLSQDVPPQRTGSFDGAPGAMPVTDAGVGTALATGQVCLLDARAKDRYAGLVEPLDARAGHVPGAFNAPFQENLAADKSFRSPAQLQAYYRAIVGDRPMDAVACMCGSGVTACHTLLALEVAGLPGAALYAGSWSDWISDPARPISTTVATANED
jgi:thiosulfate/3-mercaptopyruvate sulfurtransferase